jgi:hypothetical protein
MAVLVEAISVIVRLEAINSKFFGGWPEFVNCVPNRTMCTDGELVRVGFMVPSDVETFVNLLESLGLVFLRNDCAIDLAVVDQMTGPTRPADWLEFGQLSLNGNGNKVAACWLVVGAGFRLSAQAMPLATPEGWTYEVSAGLIRHTREEFQNNLKYLRHESGCDVYLNLVTGKEVYIGRPKIG